MTVQLFNSDSRTFNWGEHFGKEVRLVIADPPYGVDYVSNYGKTAKWEEYARRIDGDEDLASALATFTDVLYNLEPYLVDDLDMYVFTRWDLLHHWRLAVEEMGIGFRLKNALVWNKGHVYLGDFRGDWPRTYELILFFKRGARPLEVRRDSVLEYAKPSPKFRIHPTQKPVPLLEELIVVSSEPGDIIVDPFAGSAASLLAARNRSRQAFGVEKDKTYYNLAENRLSQMALPGFS